MGKDEPRIEVLPPDKKSLEDMKNLPMVVEQGLSLTKDPDTVIEEAQKAARALMGVLNNKKRKVVINGKRLMEFDDWQLLGTFYGVTAKVLETRELTRKRNGKSEFHGFWAKVAAIRNGQEISIAEAECLASESNWRNKAYSQRFMLRSMAQTRASSKVLSNVLRWIAILAGCDGTPAEEAYAKEEKLPKAQIRTIQNTMKRKGVNKKELYKFIEEEYGADKISELTASEAKELLVILSKVKKGGKLHA